MWDGVCPLCKKVVPQEERDTRRAKSAVQMCIRCRRLNRARIPHINIIDSGRYDITRYTEQNQAKIKGFIQSIAKGKWGVIGGQVGVGKTMTAIVSIYEAIKLRTEELSGGYNVRYCSVQLWSAEYAEGGYLKGEIYEQLTMGIKLLFLDDLGRESNTELIRRVIAEAELNSMQIVITTNLSTDEIKKTYKENIWSRILGGSGRGCAFLKLDGTDQRKHKQKEADSDRA